MQHIFTASEYYKILDLPSDSSVEEIKKAYRKKARLFHPDINHSPDAKEQFICATEAYEFLLAYHEKIKSDEQAYAKAMEDWRKYRQYRSRKRATAYARTPYATFKNTRFYRTTRIFDGTAILFSFGISVMVLIYTIYGYIFRLRNPVPGLEKPSVFTFVMLLLLGVTFFSISFIYLKAYLDTPGKKGKK
ncbi:MAG: DnaJ domain-containing protein [Bacteroidales bacterium]|nr:DnaJ domain-containing protein [Bacteroidales bacterium]